jgi:hypothetical protein
MVEGSPPGTSKSADRPTPAPGAARAEPCQIAGKHDQAENASVRLIVILVGLSGSGKTTVLNRLLRENYQTRNLEFAEVGFRETLELHPDDGPSKFYLEKLEELRSQNLPGDWATHTILKEK